MLPYTFCHICDPKVPIYTGCSDIDLIDLKSYVYTIIQYMCV